ncbi:MAG: MFS transporter, partial [Burkholderiaceae bacterium]|nr:MFS transporter [Burkholderiaceae bacterium]
GFVFAVLSRRLVEFLGEGGLIRWGGAFMCIALLAVGYAPTWGGALAGCILLGLGYYMLHNTLQVNATQMAPEQRGAAVSAFASCFYLGQSVGVSLGGLWVGVIGTDSFLAIGAIGVLGVAIAFHKLRRRHLRAMASTAA